MNNVSQATNVDSSISEDTEEYENVALEAKQDILTLGRVKIMRVSALRSFWYHRKVIFEKIILLK